MIDKNKILDKEVLDSFENRFTLVVMFLIAISLTIYIIKSNIIDEIIMYPESIIPYLLFIIFSSFFFGVFISQIIFKTILTPIRITTIYNLFKKGR